MQLHAQTRTNSHKLAHLIPTLLVPFCPLRVRVCRCFPLASFRPNRNVPDTVTWLTSLQGADLSKYAAAVQENQITGAKLTSLAPTELLDLLGVSSVGHKTVIRSGLAALIREAHTSLAATPISSEDDSEDENGMIKDYDPGAELRRERSHRQFAAITRAEQLAEQETITKLVEKEKRLSRASIEHESGADSTGLRTQAVVWKHRQQSQQLRRQIGDEDEVR